MSLFKSSFYILGASLRDKRQQIVDLAEEKSLFSDPEQCNAAKNSLINPRTRLQEEMSWLPGMSPKRANQVMVDLDKQQLFPTETLIEAVPLAQCNILATLIENYSKSQHNTDLLFIEESIHSLAESFEEIDTGDILQIINEDRNATGFPLIQNEEQVSDQLQILENKYIDVIESSIFANKPYALILLTNLIEYYTDEDDYIPRLIEQSVDRCRLDVAPQLEELYSETETFLEELKEELRNNPSKFRERIGILDKKTDKWNELTKPFQLLDNYRGLDEEKTSDYAKAIRGFGVFLANELDLWDEAYRITDLLKEKFPLLNLFNSRLDEDIEKLDEVLEQREQLVRQTEQERKTWEKEISLDLLIGSTQLSIRPEVVTFGNNSIPLNEISRVRWGVFKGYTNGVRTSRNFTIWVGTSKKLLEIECTTRFWESDSVVMRRYTTIINKLWKAVCVRLLTNLLDELMNGNSVEIGGITINRRGLLLRKHGFLSSEPMHVPWNELSWTSRDGSLYIQSSKQKNVYLSLSYRDQDNTHILEALLDYLVKDGNYRKLPPEIEMKSSNTENSEVTKQKSDAIQPSKDSNFVPTAICVVLAAGVIFIFASALSGTGSKQSYTTNQTAPTQQQVPAQPFKPPVKTITATQIINDISPVLSSLKAVNPNHVNIKGKLLVWDQSRSAVSDLQNKISSDLQWKENYEGKTTVMIITGYADEQVGNYGSGIPAYKRTANILMVSWPDKTPLGKVSIIGDDPPQSIRYKSKPSAIYGEINQPITRWIEGCPKTL